MMAAAATNGTGHKDPARVSAVLEVSRTFNISAYFIRQVFKDGFREASMRMRGKIMTRVDLEIMSVGIPLVLMFTTTGN